MTWKQRANEVRTAFERFAASRPLLALGLSLSIGVMTGWLVKRR